MNCYECATQDEEVPAVALCPHCNVGIGQARGDRGRGGIERTSPSPAASCAVSAATAPAGVQDEIIDAELGLLAKAVGHPARAKILRVLLARDSCFCGEIVEQLPLAQATVSQHLKVLKDAGLIRGEIEGLRTCYCADRERLTRLHDLLGGLLADAVELAEDRRRGCN
jgi:ArsR family transcriptional regulator, arsenate/arsenite/antimonite-responsive transcriptional repressor